MHPWSEAFRNILSSSEYLRQKSNEIKLCLNQITSVCAAYWKREKCV